MVWSGRSAGRHRWFLDGARNGAPDVERLEAWLAADRPGEGADWQHASDAAARLVSWGVGASMCELPDETWARLVGSATAHAVFTSDRLAIRDGDHRAVLQAAGLAIAGMVFGVAEAREWKAEGLSQLEAFLPHVILADGSGDVRTVGRAVAATWAVLELARSTGTSVSPALEAAVQRAAPFLVLLGHGGPVETTYEPLLGWEDELFRGLAPDELQVEKDWSLRAFREGGVGIAHARLAKADSRLVFHDGEVRWHVGGQPVLTGGPRDVTGLSVARIDGRRVTLVADGEGSRELRLEGGRAQFVDRGTSEVRFDVGLPIEKTEKGYALQGDGFRLAVSLDEQLAWTVQGATFIGRGRADRVRTSFEVR
ncbi:MAG: hypothetical protein GY884_23225 [Proteobacteria bacterium]|nr:hypothetical protein [Pseudomonadota bacterium]